MKKRHITALVVSSTVLVAAGVWVLAFLSPSVEVVGLQPVSELQAIALVQRGGPEHIELVSVGLGPTWSVQLDADERPTKDAVNHGLSVARGIVAARTLSGRSIEAWRTEDGAKAWGARLEPGQGRPPAVAIDGDAAQIFTWSGARTVHALERDSGALAWSLTLEHDVKTWVLGTRSLVALGDDVASVVDRELGVLRGTLAASGAVCLRPGAIFGLVGGELVRAAESMQPEPEVIVPAPMLGGMERVIACGFRDEDLVVTAVDEEEGVVMIRVAPERMERMWRVVVQADGDVSDAMVRTWPSTLSASGELGRMVPVVVSTSAHEGDAIVWVDVGRGEVAARTSAQSDFGALAITRIGPMHYAYDRAGREPRLWAMHAERVGVVGALRAPGLSFGPTARRGRALWVYQERRTSSMRALRWLVLDPVTLAVRAAGNDGLRATVEDDLRRVSARLDGIMSAP